jgi:hypothetical protein
VSSLQVIIEAKLYAMGEGLGTMDRRHWLSMMGASLVGRPGMRARAAQPSDSEDTQSAKALLRERSPAAKVHGLAGHGFQKENLVRVL